MRDTDYGRTPRVSSGVRSLEQQPSEKAAVKPLGPNAATRHFCQIPKLNEIESQGFYSVKNYSSTVRGSQPKVYVATVHPLDSHLPAATEHKVQGQPLQDQETLLPTRPAHLLSSLPTLLAPLLPRPCSRANKTHPANSNHPLVGAGQAPLRLPHSAAESHHPDGQARPHGSPAPKLDPEGQEWSGLAIPHLHLHQPPQPIG